ncbi:hypothetical protein E4U21_006130 [Claviceps maximensis]|nr:hypothetical protein E4U21_006130 [Claviceps maximensis]
MLHPPEDLMRYLVPMPSKPESKAKTLPSAAGKVDGDTQGTIRKREPQESRPSKVPEAINNKTLACLQTQMLPS